MRKRYLLTATLLAALASSPAAAQDAEEALVTFQVLAPKLAVDLALATLDACSEAGFQVTVAVVDRFGITQALVRDRFAGPHTPETAQRKAWTAASFRTDTMQMVEVTASGQPQSGVRHIGNALMVGGGVQVIVGGQLVGAVGVSGAPAGDQDDACARAGIAAIQDRLPL